MLPPSAQCATCRARAQETPSRPHPRSAGEFADQCRKLAAATRAVASLPTAEKLSEEGRWQRQIIGGAFVHWLNEIGPRFLEDRAALTEAAGLDPDPVIVFTTCPAGLVAAREIVDPSDPRIVCLLHRAFTNSPVQVSDDRYRWHVHVWSYFQSEPEEDFAAAAGRSHPLPPGSTYWQHTEGTMWAPGSGRGVDHLWRWDGRQAALLREAFTSWTA